MTLTLNGVVAFILLFSPNSIALLANYVIVVKDTPNVRKIIVYQLQSSTFGRY